METNGLSGESRGFGADAIPQDTVDPLDLEGDEPATEEEQADYDLVVSRAVKYMHKNGRESTLKQLSAAESPAEAIGRTAASIMTAVVRSAKQQGKKFDDGVLFHAGVEIVEELADYGREAGIFDFKDEQEAIDQTEQGLMFALKFFGEQGLGSGLIPPEDIDRAKDTMEMALVRESQEDGNVTQGVRRAIAETPPKGQGLVNAQRGQ